jgi:uncharacterized repeat protein (TIGR04138 family)
MDQWQIDFLDDALNRKVRGIRGNRAKAGVCHLTPDQLFEAVGELALQRFGRSLAYPVLRYWGMYYRRDVAGMVVDLLDKGHWYNNEANDDYPVLKDVNTGTVLETLQ